MKFILAAVAALVLSGSVMANERGENFGAVGVPTQVQPRHYTKAELNKFKLPFEVDKFYLGD